ncbi:ATP-binding cassette domain-containing protein [Dermatobacter hominis]|uniref:ATP-binding cassette domain-containing protein n=1 Tax=Dermatobacter hominis TaxID=2884263 RepID=UPI0035ABCE96
MIETKGLTRHFGSGRGDVVEAVRGIDLRVGAGELVAFLGPNGAGKSTTLRMLTTLLQPTAGTATVVGRDIREDPAGVRRRIGYIGQGNGAAHAQRVRDELVVQGRIYGMGRAEAERRSDQLLESLELGGLERRTVSTLSGGQRRRLDIALGMVHLPRLLFLDEPSTGLDPQNRANLQHVVERLRVEHGTTVVLTTHYLDEADALADRVVVIDHGTVIADDTPERLKAGTAGDRVRLVAPSVDDVPVVAEALRGATGVEPTVDGTGVTVHVRDGAQLVGDVIVELRSRGVRIASTEVARPTLDDVFLALTGRSLREGAPGHDAPGTPPSAAAGPDTSPTTDAAAPAATAETVEVPS